MALRQRLPFRKSPARNFEDSANYHIPDSLTQPHYSCNDYLKSKSKPVIFKKGTLRDIDSFVRTDCGILCILSAFSIFTRFFRLSKPNAVVFDELHFGGFMESLLQGKFAFDIHPWLGKLTLAFFAWLTGYREQGFEFQTGIEYTNGDYYYARVPSAMFGSLCIPLMYLIARELHVSRLCAFVTACLPLFDNLLLVESRLILIDAQLIFYLKLSLLCALRMFNLVENSKRGTLRFYRYLIATALSCSAAMSVKWTAGATPFLIAVVCAFGVWHLRRPLPVSDCIIAAIVGFTLYVVPWYVFVQIAKESTPSAVRMSNRFRSTLHGNASIPFNATNDYSFPEAFKELHVRQFVANRIIKTRHQWESKWYEWPLNMRGIFYYVARNVDYSEEHPFVRAIYLIQNPAGALWVFAAVAFLTISLPVFIRYRVYILKDHPVYRLFRLGSFLLSGYFINLLPYIFVERCYFLYHYLPALTYGQLLLGLCLDTMPTRMRNIFVGLILGTVIASFIYWSPWVYAFTMHMTAFLNRRLMPRWD